MEKTYDPCDPEALPEGYIYIDLLDIFDDYVTTTVVKKGTKSVTFQGHEYFDLFYPAGNMFGRHSS